MTGQPKESHCDRSAIHIGDLWIETTPGGSRFRMEIEATDIEPKYRRGREGRVIRLRGVNQPRRVHEMFEEDLLNCAPWLVPERSYR